MTSKLTVDLCNLIRCRRYHYLTDAFPKSAEKLRVNGLLLQIKRSYKILVKVLIETKVYISNPLNFSDVYLSVNYTWSLAKFT